jgi:transposase-like protein
VSVNRRHARTFKLDLCKRIESGAVSKAQACREHQLAPSMLDRWVARYRERGEAAFQASSRDEAEDPSIRIAQLEQALGQAYLDIKILQEALKVEALKKRGPSIS